MQIVCIYSGVSNYEQKLDYIFNIFKSTLEELGVEIAVFDVSKLNINFFNGTKVSIIETIFNNMKNANGIIFATTAQRLAPNGAMQSFLEHMDHNLYGNILKDKTCISIITSIDNSEYMAGNYMDTLVSSFGGTPINGMFVGTEYLTNIETSISITQMIERYAEDFYRGVKQNRKYFIVNPFKDVSKMYEKAFNSKENNYKNEEKPINNSTKNSEHFTTSARAEDTKQIRSLTGSQVANLYQKEVDNNIYSNYDNNMNNLNEYLKNQQNNEKIQNTTQQNLNNYNNKQNNNPINYNNIYGEQANFNSNNLTRQKNYELPQSSQTIQEFNSIQEDDISELTKLLSQKFKEETERNNDLNQYINNSYQSNGYSENITPNINTLKQKTQRLYHYFQPQLANGINIIIQVIINGKENFNGYFSIRNGECSYTEGISPNPDVSVLSDANVWEEVLDGKSTLQKAFMLGRLKVKGNFVLISKFEQFFKIN
ncbi:MAG: SCP2 sterol-binding domain-containing protein [Eubacteriales bacterium]|nr:SCP2 sterol-binding domain-containing protein [Eubacteriales bacterium]